MKSRSAIGYVVLIDGVDITLNMLDKHRGHLASHSQGVSIVAEVGSLLGIDVGGRLLVMKVLSLAFAEPREAHRFGAASNSSSAEPLRNLTGVVVGQLKREASKVRFIADSLSTPSLGSEVYPLTQAELSAVLGDAAELKARVHLGDDLRGGGRLVVGLENFISRHVAVLGSSGQGKSCLTAAVLQQVVQMPRSRIVVFDINGEYEDAFPSQQYAEGVVKITRLGGTSPDAFRLPYYALGRLGLQRLLMPSDKTQRPALAFALDHLHQVSWFQQARGIGLANDQNATLFDDCRSAGAPGALQAMSALRDGTATPADVWPSMRALGPLIAESHCLVLKNNVAQRDAYLYGNVAPLLTRVWRLTEDAMFRDVVNVAGGAPTTTGALNWRREAKALVDLIFGGSAPEPWRIHIVDLRRLSHDLTPFVLGALLELYAYELFRRGQANKVATMLVLEEAHHYLRSVGSGEDEANNALAYERLAKEGRKFGLALWLSTQRPSELSPTVLSQCNNWISFRLTSEKDLNAVQWASEWADRREVKRIAGLARQHALAFGGSIQMPTLIRAATAAPLPRSEDGRFDDWTEPYPTINIDDL
ncbi:MAG: ATP-binding protein [Dokdonella sp.]|uniref:anti-phage-associated helicase HerA n=1 Tax=Dokdonella sp. TaxID=2291710 RepID=UPI0025BCBB94|nr:anti-phage-associated helicase HerA [Dokdonella sp.]MBZ0223283.1 ATP-binding protein [Dokdonella sp.]